MALDLDKISKRFDEILHSPETEEYFRQVKIKQDIQYGRFDKFESYLEKYSFEMLLKRVIKEHDEVYREKCFKRGCEDYPTNKMQFIYDYVTNRIDPIQVAGITDGMFYTECRFFKGYYFTITHGQGCFYRIYDSNKTDICTI
jgi:hypothetical protein